jgi:hypothetical protein
VINSRRSRIAAGGATTIVAMAFAASAASASSIVFTKNGNVWLANPDGSGQYQVTLDGTAAAPYRSPSQADDGTIFAIRGEGTHATFNKMKQNGELLAAPFEGSAPGTGPLEASISPDGTKAAYSFLTSLSGGCYPYTCTTYDGRVLYTYSDRFTRFDEIEGPNTYGDDPSWIDNGQIFFANNSATIWTDVVGPTTATGWFDDYNQPGSYGSMGQTLRDGEALAGTVALVRVNEGHTGNPPADGSTSLQLYSYTGTSSPATPTCAIRSPGTGSQVPPMEDPTLSPDATVVAWQDPSGINTISTNCADATPSRLIIPGGSEPDFGPANVNPGPRQTTGTGTGTGTGPGTGAGGGGGQGGGQGSGGDTLAPTYSVATSGKAPKLAKALKGGVTFAFSCSEACTVDATLLQGSKLVGRGKASLIAAGNAKLKVKFTKAAKKSLRRKKSVKLKLKSKVTDAAGNSRSSTRSLKLKK